MANISDAVGKIILKGDWGKHEAIMLAYLIEAVWNNHGGDYGIYCDTNMLEVANKLLTNQYSFFGSGRWNLETTLINSMDRLDFTGEVGKDKGRGITGEEFKALYKMLIKSMHEKDLEFQVEYNEMEIGAHFIGRGVVSWNSDGERIKPSDSYFDEIEQTLKARIDLFDLGYEDVYDIMYNALYSLFEKGEVTDDIIAEITGLAMRDEIYLPMDPYFEDESDLPEVIREMIKRG